MFRSLLALTLALSLTACSSSNDTMDDADAPAVTVEGTIAAATASGGVLQIPAEAAVANINGWINTLEGMDGTAPVVANLRALRSELTSSTLDGAEIGRILSALGTQTSGVANGNADLLALGSALSDAGNSLTM
jgi:hypothetical protein